MKLYLNIVSCLSIILLITGCSRQMSFTELVENVPEVPDTQTYSSTNMNYTISVIERFKLVEDDYSETSGFELFIDTTHAFEDGTNLLSIFRYNSTESTLQGAWNKLTAKRAALEGFTIYSSGPTDYLSQNSFYEHSAGVISGKNVETISFLLKGNSSDFWLLSIQVNKDDGYPKNLKELLFCARSVRFIR